MGARMPERVLPGLQPVLPAHRIGPVERCHRRLAAANRLGIVAEGHGGVGVAGELGDEANLDALGLQRRDEGMSRRMRCYVRHAQLREHRLPITAAIVLVEQGATAADPGNLRPGLEPARAREDPVQRLARPRTAQPPLQQERAQDRAHRNVARAGFGLGHIGQRTVALLDAADADDVGVEVDILPKQAELLGRARAGEEREGIIKSVLRIVPGRLDQLADLGGREDDLLRLDPVAAETARHRRRPHPEILLVQGEDRDQVRLRPVGGVLARQGG